MNNKINNVFTASIFDEHGNPASLPIVQNFATKAEVDEKIPTALLLADSVVFTADIFDEEGNKACIPIIQDYATKEYVDEKIKAVDTRVPLFKQVIANDDGTVTITHQNNTVVNITPVYNEADILTDIIYDKGTDKEKSVSMTYDEKGNLRAVGQVKIDIAKLPQNQSKLLENTVTFMVEGKPYEIVSVKDGNQVGAPLTEPTSASGSFKSWNNNGAEQTFPFIPNTDTDLTATFGKSLADELYAFYGVDKKVYPYLIFSFSKVGYDTRSYINFSPKAEKYDNTRITVGMLNGINLKQSTSKDKGVPSDFSDLELCVKTIKEQIAPSSLAEYDFDAFAPVDENFYCNFAVDNVVGTIHRLDQ